LAEQPIPIISAFRQRFCTQTYFGYHFATHVTSLPPVTTVSGYTITANLNNFVLTGNGLRGVRHLQPEGHARTIW
jgi:hypothetical protein